MDAVEDVKARLSVEDVVGDYIELKRAGRNWRGLSPWTSEKTPSLMVSPDKQIWHDFSSGQGGNIFSFVMEFEGLEFKGALEILARKAGIDLEQYRQNGASRGPSKERLYKANETATHYYQTQFIKSKIALDYVAKKRQFTKETALTWRLGYAPSDPAALVNHLKDRKYSAEEIKRAGLTNSYNKAMFRDRLMVPLADGQGRVIGFTARQLKDEKNSPKYINTPATVIYDKSRQVFGLHLAKEAIRKKNYVVLAEGNLDVIASHQAGINNVVATAGTALTEQHLKILARFTDDIRLAFDADKAGVTATKRAIVLASKAGVNLSIIDVPAGKDPDELIRRDKAEWLAIVEQPKYAVDWLIARYQAELDLATAKGKREFSDVLLPIIKQLTDRVEQDHYLNKISQVAEISRSALDDKIAGVADKKSASKKYTKQAYTPPQEDTLTVENRKIEQHLLAIILKLPNLITKASLIERDMLTEQAQKAWQLLHSSGEAAVQKLGDYGKMLELEFEELYQGLEVSELTYEVERLQARLIEQYVKMKKGQIAHQLGAASDDQSQQLLNEAKRLDSLLNRVTNRGGYSA